MNIELLKLVDEFIAVPRGIKISDPGRQIIITGNTSFTRRSFKHFIESRLSVGNTKDDIIFLVSKIFLVINMPELDIKNPKNKYIDSRILGIYFPDISKAVIVVIDCHKLGNKILSVHFKKRRDFYKLLKLDT